MLKVRSDMANIDIAWDIDGVLAPKVSVSGMLQVITARTIEDSGSFWTWDGKVSISTHAIQSSLIHCQASSMVTTEEHNKPSCISI